MIIHSYASIKNKYRIVKIILNASKIDIIIYNERKLDKREGVL